MMSNIRPDVRTTTAIIEAAMRRAELLAQREALELEAKKRGPAPIKGIVRPKPTGASKKRDLLEQARRAGWKGKSVKKARQFERALERQSRGERDGQ